MLLLFTLSFLLLGTWPAWDGFITFLTVTSGWIVSLALHEFCHAYTAYRHGDLSVKEKGYLSLNPLLYTHPFLSIVVPVLFLLMGGIGLPGGAVYINMQAIKSRRALSLVSLAGPAANVAVALILLIMIHFFPVTPPRVPAVSLLLFLQISAILFNMLPIPGLDGFGFLQPWLPPALLSRFRDLTGIIMLALMYAFFTDSFVSRAFWKVVIFISNTIGVDFDGVWKGFSMMRFWETI